MLHYIDLHVYNPITRQRYKKLSFLAETEVSQKSWLSGEARMPEKGLKNPIEKFGENVK